MEILGKAQKLIENITKTEPGKCWFS